MTHNFTDHKFKASDLFDNLKTSQFSRRSDPVTSKQAVIKNKENINGQVRTLHENIKRYGKDFTAREIFNFQTDICYFTVQKRLSVLQRLGYIDKGEEQRDGQKIWRLIS